MPFLLKNSENLRFNLLSLLCVVLVIEKKNALWRHLGIKNRQSHMHKYFKSKTFSYPESTSALKPEKNDRGAFWVREGSQKLLTPVFPKNSVSKS